MEGLQPITLNTTEGTAAVPTEKPETGRRRGRPPMTEYKGAGKTVVLLPQTGREDEIRTFRINGRPYHIKVGQQVNVPDALYDHIMDLSNRKKLSAKAVAAFAGDGKSLGDLK